ncbi:MAG: hypothetical protein ACYS8I_07985 [Planctomycetota bacterium]|jgi:hypothetical protein
MEALNVGGESGGGPKAPVEAGRTSKGFVYQQVESFVLRLVDNPALLKDYFSLTGGSILYCLSGLSILYGIAKIMTPLLAKSNVFGDALPCIVALNMYELALLGVLVTIVTWKNVTDDAISLVVLVALFLVASGAVLGAGGYHAPGICLCIGLVCTGLGIGKLCIMRRFISFKIGILSLVGMTLILLWNFLASSAMAGCFASTPEFGETHRVVWLGLSSVLLAGGGLVVGDAATSRVLGAGAAGGQGALLERPVMVWIFALIVFVGAAVHQEGIAYMYRVQRAFGDYIPIISVGSLLVLELGRGLGKRFRHKEAVICCVPLACTIYAVLDGAFISGPQVGSELLWYPPVILGLTGLAVLLVSIRHGWRELVYIVLLYILGLLLTVGYSPEKPYDLNWHLCGGGAVVMLLILGVIHRNVFLCFAAVIALAGGIASTDWFVGFAVGHDLTIGGGFAGMAGLGAMGLCLVFGRKAPRAITLAGASLLMICVFDYLGASLRWEDVPVAVGTVVVCGALWLRTRDIAGVPILSMPLARKVYILLRVMSYWGFVVLGFCLLFLGGAVSLFCKHRKETGAS